MQFALLYELSTMNPDSFRPKQTRERLAKIISIIRLSAC